MSNPQPSRPATDDDDKGKNTETGAHAPGPVPGEPDAGRTTGAEQAAENRENDPPA